MLPVSNLLSRLLLHICLAAQHCRYGDGFARRHNGALPRRKECKNELPEIATADAWNDLGCVAPGWVRCSAAADSNAHTSVPLATSAEEIVGTWQKTIGAGYIRFYEDGTFHQARAPGDLDSKPFAICEFRFEGTQMFTKEISVSGVPSCGDTPGINEVQLLEGEKMEIVSIEDKCVHRRRDTATVYEPVR